ncbi:hypothetical protein D3C72_1774550 [compost metagenome]
MHHGLDPLGVAFQLLEQLFRRPQVSDRMLGYVLPLGEVGRLQPVADDHVPGVARAQPGHDVGADEARAAGHHDHARGHLATPGVIFSIVLVVE